MGDRKAFFYGTLMAPAVLHRVCHGNPSPPPSSWQAQSLSFSPAILHHHRRHRVRYADYPAIVPTSPSEESSVRGTFVSGLTDGDVWRLDIFEGEEYTRRRVKVRLLSSGAERSLEELMVRSSGAVGGIGKVASCSEVSEEEEDMSGREEMMEGSEEIEAETYIWTGPRDALEDQEWDFEEFTREKMRRWVGGESNEEYSGEIRPSIREVDEAVAAAKTKDPTGGRGANGTITRELESHGSQHDELLRNAV